MFPWEKKWWKNTKQPLFGNKRSFWKSEKSYRLVWYSKFEIIEHKWIKETSQTAKHGQTKVVVVKMRKVKYMTTTCEKWRTKWNQRQNSGKDIYTYEPGMAEKSSSKLRGKITDNERINREMMALRLLDCHPIMNTHRQIRNKNHGKKKGRQITVLCKIPHVNNDRQEQYNVTKIKNIDRKWHYSHTREERWE